MSVHCEPLSERSRRHNWHIRAHSHDNLIQIFLLTEGIGDAGIDGLAVSIRAPLLLVVPAGCVHGFSWHQGCQGYAISVVADAVRVLVPVSDRHRFDNPSQVTTAGCEPLLASVCEEIIHASALQNQGNEYLDSLLRVLLLWILRQQQGSENRQPSTRAARHYRKFVTLLKQQQEQRLTLQQMASKIGITASHLNAICHSESGRSALSLLHQQRITQAQRLLAYTDSSIAEVGRSLGFTDASYFTRFFKRQLGLTPRQFRRASGTVAGQSAE